MKKVISWLLIVALTAAVAVGGTLAYLTDTDEDTNVMTLGNVKIDQLEYERVDVETKDGDAVVQEFHDNKPLYPAVTENGFNWTTDASVDWSQIGKDGYTSGIWDPEKINNEQDKMVFVKNKGDYDAYVRSVFAFEANGYTLDQFNELFHLNINETDWTWEWVETPVAIPNNDGSVTTNYIVATATYNKVLKPGEFTEISLAQIALDPAAGNEDIAGFGETYQILVKTQAIQADGFENPDAALKDGFGDAADNLPFENDSPIKGIDLKTAIRYYEGNKSQSIVSKVKNVYIDKVEKYPHIPENYQGTLVDVLQDVGAYAYYVPNGDLYDVYVLSTDVIYANTGKTLFYNMVNLETVDFPNMDTSKCTAMDYMFYRCPKLKQVDASGWDTSKVTNMYAMFAACAALTEVDVTGWDTSLVTNAYGMFMDDANLERITGTECWNWESATDMSWMFQNNQKLTYIDASNWNMGSVVELPGLFMNCYCLETIEGTENWDLSNVVNMYGTFYCNYALKELDVSTWRTSSCTSLDNTFRGCRSLTTLDVSNWDVSKVEVFKSMFSGIGDNAGDMKLKDLDVSQWDMSSAKDLNWMFYGCGELTELDLSAWDVSNVETMHHTFADCFKMENYNFSGWDTSKVTTMDGIFNSNLSLKTVDVSDFDTQNVEDFDQVFDGCTSLETIIGLDHWDTSSGKYFREFLLNTKVKVLDLSAFDMSSATHTSTMIYINSELTTIYVGDNWNLNPDQLVDSVSMFAGNSKLVGGNGTTYNGSITNAAYAHVDTAENPGYLTYKN